MTQVRRQTVNGKVPRAADSRRFSARFLRLREGEPPIIDEPYLREAGRQTGRSDDSRLLSEVAPLFRKFILADGLESSHAAQIFGARPVPGRSGCGCIPTPELAERSVRAQPAAVRAFARRSARQ